MQDPRYDRFAEVLTTHSTKVSPGDKVLIDLFDAPAEIGLALIRKVRSLGGTPFIVLHNSLITRELMIGATEEQYELLSELSLDRMKHMSVYIAIRGSHNINETSDVSKENLHLVSNRMREVTNYRVNNTRWVVCRWPHPGMAQLAGMSTPAFEDFFFRVCNLDYGKMFRAMEPLKERMENTRDVHITGPGTDLRFSIAGQKAISCGGERNIPDGEVFTSPVLESVNGTVSYNAPTIYLGKSFDSIVLTFRDGKIVEASANRTQDLNDILDSDEGARFVGEFAIGFNPEIREPMRDILFDEKISGSFHFTPGQAYEAADNGNRSQIHWDMVCIQRSDYGGGEIWFDGELIRKDGLFVTSDLIPLNPENLV